MPKDIEQQGTHPKGTVAERLKSLRNTAGLTRKEMEINHNVRCASLISWEKGHRLLKKDKAERLASVFKNYSIPCTAEWILTGKGPNPLELAAQYPEEAYLLGEIHRFQAFHKGCVVTEVKDTYMAPWINKGDFVGGVFVDLAEKERFVDQMCIVQTRDFGTQTRLVQQSGNGSLYNLVSFSGNGNILNVELETVARITFVRRR